MLDIDKNPWLGLESYQTQQAAMFFGRQREVATLCEAIRNEPCTVVYGKSGTGKTSLIHAGVIPVMVREGYLPVVIKLEHGQTDDYTDQIIRAVEDALEAQGGETESALPDDFPADFHQRYRFWLYFHAQHFWTNDNRRLTPLIFIDQFEELFTLNGDRARQAGLFRALDELFQPLPPDEALREMEEKGLRVNFHHSGCFRVVLSLREDFLARLEDFARHIPELRRNRIGVAPVNGMQALSIILRQSEQGPDRPANAEEVAGTLIDRPTALRIIQRVSQAEQVDDNPETLADISMETCILSLFCSQLYKKAAALGHDAITTTLVDQQGGNIISDYYAECIKGIPRDSVEFLEDHLLTASGFRNSLAYEDIVPHYVDAKAIRQLEHNRLIRVEVSNKTERVEFTHDVLCGEAMEHKRHRQAGREQRGRLASVARHAIEVVLVAMVAGAALLFPWEISDFNNPHGLILMLIITFVPLLAAMLLRLGEHTVRRRSVGYAILTLAVGVLAFVVGFAGIIVFGEDNVDDGALLLFSGSWSLVYFLLMVYSFILSLRHQRRGKFVELLCKAFVPKEWTKSIRVSLIVLAMLCLMMVVGAVAIYMMENFIS